VRSGRISAAGALLWLASGAAPCAALNDVPAGEYQVVAWHEGWKVKGRQQTFDVLTVNQVQRPVFSGPQTWEKKVAVKANGRSEVSFVISNN
jgi:hypothetical protein